ncbi:MAG: pyruvate kinase [Calditrichaeota bacterium]|nr:pyruvate kinase [Calditrichota bacterium]
MRKAKIVCTLGPATATEEKIVRLVNAGMDVARLNFSYGSHEEYRQRIEIIRRVAEKLNKSVAILQDLQGPKLRVGKMKNGKIFLKTGERITITTEEVWGTEKLISTTYRHLASDVSPGNAILLDDGLIKLKVLRSDGEKVECEIVEGGALSDHKGINLPGVRISQPSLTKKDVADLQFGIEQKVDFVAMSFVRHPDDILKIKKIIEQNRSEIMVIAKLEKPEAIHFLDEIIEVADGVMVARGDLGVEMPLEQVPSLQKIIIRKAIKKGKPVITATQMLESMRLFSRPTRAEVSDVANAIYDGTDAVMLSAETATGKFPVEAVRVMDKIIREAESHRDFIAVPHLRADEKTQSIADAVSNSACEAAEHLNTRAIVAFSKSGFTARMVAKYKPKTNIIAFTPSDVVRRQLNLSWGVTPFRMDYLENTDAIFAKTEEILIEKELVKKGDVVSVLLGAPIFARGTTNLMKLHVVGEGSFQR